MEEQFKKTSSKKAACLIAIYFWVIIRNTSISINKSVYKFPWVFIILIMTISLITSFILITKARAERDNYNQKLVKVSMQLDSCKTLLEIK